MVTLNYGTNVESDAKPGVNEHQTDVEQTRNYWSDRARMIGLAQNGCQLNRCKFSFIKELPRQQIGSVLASSVFHAREALVLALARRIAIMRVQRRSRRDV
jgi:hypothetical protein